MGDDICAVPGCGRAGKLTRGWCPKHYQRWVRYRDPLATKYIRSDPLTRFWAYTDRRGDDECWPWASHVDDDGYGRFTVNGKSVRVHRWITEQMIGPIPAGHEPDHTCHTEDKTCPGGPGCPHRACVNYLSHLEVVTKKVNILRGNGPTAVNARKEQCGNGHEFTPENTIRRPTGNRGCRICHREGDRRT
jgi:hypothetical protein